MAEMATTTSVPTSPTARDEREDRLALVATSGLLLLTFWFGSNLQASYLLARLSVGLDLDLLNTADLGRRLSLNMAVSGLTLLILWLVRLERVSGWVRIGVLAAISLGIAAVRMGLQEALGYNGSARWGAVAFELFISFAISAIAIGFGAAYTQTRQRLRAQERAGARQAMRAATALQALQREELRVRRSVAEGLHGTVQQHLVILGARIERLLERLETGTATDEDIADLRGVRDELDQLRERDVRGMSRLLYPAGLELGAAAAIRLLLQRIPASIGTRLEVSELAREVDSLGNSGLDTERRLLLVRLVEEGLSNALRHGHAGSVVIAVDAALDGVDAYGQPVPCMYVTVDDDGTGLPDPPPPLNGLARLDERLDAVGGTLTVSPGPMGGVRMYVCLPTPPRSAAPGSLIARQASGSPPWPSLRGNPEPSPGIE